MGFFCRGGTCATCMENLGGRVESRQVMADGTREDQYALALGV